MQLSLELQVSLQNASYSPALKLYQQMVILLLTDNFLHNSFELLSNSYYQLLQSVMLWTTQKYFEKADHTTGNINHLLIDQTVSVKWQECDAFYCEINGKLVWQLT